MDFMFRNAPATSSHFLKNEISHVFKAYNDAAPHTLCLAFSRCADQLGRHGELKKKETKLIGTYRSRVCNLKHSTLKLTTRKGKKRFQKFLVAQSMDQIAKAFIKSKEEDRERHLLKLMKGDKCDVINEDEDIEGMEEECTVNCYFENLLQTIFKEKTL